jgi:hypothetical protein
MSFIGAMGALGSMTAGAFDDESMKRRAEEDVRQKDARFMALFQRAQVGGDPAAMEQLLDDPQFRDVSPDVRNKVMQRAAQEAQAAAAQANADRSYELDIASQNAKTQRDAAAQRAAGFEVDVTPGGGPTQEEMFRGIAPPDPLGQPRPPEEGFDPGIGQPNLNAGAINFFQSMGKGRQEIEDALRPQVGGEGPLDVISRQERGPELEQQFDAQTRAAVASADIKETQSDQLAAEFEDYNKKEDRIQNALYRAVRNQNYLQFVDDDIKEELAGRMSDLGIELGGKKKAPLAFMLRMAELRSALAELDNLEERLKGAGYWAQGPVVGLLAKVPFTESKRLRAAIDRVKQRVGKALEGGVLRKEDEEKYKKILPTIYDDALTSQSKLDGLRGALRRDVEILTQTFTQFNAFSDQQMDDTELQDAMMAKVYQQYGASFGYERGTSFIDNYLER